jgi:hypothetical protein
MSDKRDLSEQPPSRGNPVGQSPDELPDALERAEREAARRWLLQMSNRARNERLANGQADRRRNIACR